MPLGACWSSRKQLISDVCVTAGGRSGVLVEFSAPSFYFRSYGDLSDEEMDRVCQFLHNRVQDQERTQLYQLTACFKSFKRYMLSEWDVLFVLVSDSCS